MSDKKVEFIESYIKHGNTDYEWIDNHGELIRCKDCKYWHNENEKVKSTTWLPCMEIDPRKEWYCADGERRNEDA